MKPSEAKILIKEMALAREPVLLVGPPGIGKSDLVDQVIDEIQHDLIMEHPVTSDPTDFKGLGMATSATEANFLPFGNLNQMIKATRPTYVFIDDLGQAPTSVQAAAMQLLLARRINGHKISDFVTFGAATNRREDKASVSGIIEPTKSRFSIINLEVDVMDWEKWALAQPDFPIELIAACRFKPQWLTDWVPSNAIENSPCPRNVAKVAKLMQMNVPDSMRYELYASRLGQAAATELMAFLNLYQHLPTIDQIVLDPMNTAIPNNPGSMWALMTALGKRANQQNFGPVMQYVNRIPKEYQVMLMKTLAHDNKSLLETRTFIEWSTDNQGIMI